MEKVRCLTNVLRGASLQLFQGNQGRGGPRCDEIDFWVTGGDDEFDDMYLCRYVRKAVKKTNALVCLFPYLRY